jgi:ABC-type lipoprotein release transport system permease subunit
MRDAIASLPGVDWVRKESFVPTTVENQPAVLIAMSYADGGPLAIPLAQGEPGDLRARLQAGEVVVARVLATRCQLQVGEPLVLQTLDGPRSFPIAGIADEYTAGGMSLYMDWHVAEAALGVDWVSVFAVACRHEDPEGFQRLSQFCEDHHVHLYSQAAFRELINNAVQGTKGALWFVSALICTMAALGLSKAVVLLSVHQKRELKLLYVLGAVAAQLRRVLLVQGMVLVIVGSALGLIMGIALGFVFTQIVCTLEGHPADYSIRWSVVFSCLVGAHVVGFVAASTASLSSRAARTPRINVE